MNNPPLTSSSLWLSYITSNVSPENTNTNCEIIEKTENLKKIAKSFKCNRWIKVQEYGINRK